MRKLILFISFLIFSLAMQAQVKTYVYGKLESLWADTVSLHTWDYFPVHTDYFDDKAENKITISTNVQPDSTFWFSTDLLSAKYTTAIFSVKGISAETLLLSPGDSLGIAVSGPIGDSEFSFYGKGAGKNTFITNKDDELTSIGAFPFLTDDIDEVILKNKIRVYLTSRQKVLSTSLMEGKIDSTFYESILRFDNYAVLAEVYKNIKVNKSLSEDFVVNVYDSIAKIDINDLDAMSGMSYPSLISVYPEVLAKLNHQEFPGDLLSQIRIGQELFSGPIRTYFLYDLISEYVSKAETLKQKFIIIGYIRECIDDSRVLVLVKHRLSGQIAKKDKKSSAWLIVFGVFVVGLFLIWFFIRYAIRAAKKAPPTELKSSPLLLIGLILLIIVNGPLVDLILKHPIREIWPIISGVLTFMMAIIYGRVASSYLLKRKYLKHVIWVAVISVSYILGLYLTLHFFGDWSVRETNGLVLKWGVIATSAVWLVLSVSHYLFKLFEEEKDFRYLIRQIVDHLEFIIHFIIVSVFFFFLASKLDQFQGIRDMIWYITLLLIFYLVAFWIAPRYRFNQKKKTFLKLLVGVYLIAYLILYLNEGLFNQMTLRFLGVRIPLVKFFHFPEFEFFFIGVSMVLGTIYAYLRRDYFGKININLNLYRKKEAELTQLRSQVNPHFLFNSLNTVYAQALKENSEQTAESIAKLSNLMRYLIEDMERETIPIRKEIGYIHDYIRLQRVRSSVEQEIALDIELTEEQMDLEIAPMLMIPFVENAFKHGINPNKKSRLKIRIYFEKERFNFEIENSIDPDYEGFEKERGMGAGIPNVRKRLEYIYPGQHKLSIEDTEKYYLVRMSLESLEQKKSI